MTEENNVNIDIRRLITQGSLSDLIRILRYINRVHFYIKSENENHKYESRISNNKTEPRTSRDFKLSEFDDIRKQYDYEISDVELLISTNYLKEYAIVILCSLFNHGSPSAPLVRKNDPKSNFQEFNNIVKNLLGEDEAVKFSSLTSELKEIRDKHIAHKDGDAANATQTPILISFHTAQVRIRKINFLELLNYVYHIYDNYQIHE